MLYHGAILLSESAIGRWSICCTFVLGLGAWIWFYSSSCFTRWALALPVLHLTQQVWIIPTEGEPAVQLTNILTAMKKIEKNHNLLAVFFLLDLLSNTFSNWIFLTSRRTVTLTRSCLEYLTWRAPYPWALTPTRIPVEKSRWCTVEWTTARTAPKR